MGAEKSKTCRQQAGDQESRWYSSSPSLKDENPENLWSENKQTKQNPQKTPGRQSLQRTQDKLTQKNLRPM